MPDPRARNFTQGPILNSIASLAMPIMGTAFIQMAYNMADIFWIGHLGSGATAAVGAAGFFVWLANALATIPKVGAEISIAQSLGANNQPRAIRFARHAAVLALIISFLLTAALLLFNRPLIGFYRLQDPETVENACAYLRIVACAVPLTFLNATYFGLYNGIGYSQTPFWANSTGLILNVILDPLLIYGIGPFPALEVRGAAIATVIAQATVTAIFLGINLKKNARFHALLKGFRPSLPLGARLLRLGAPPGLQSALFASISMVVARIVAQWGDLGIAVQTAGSQIEAISYMTAGGFASALGSFVGQNYAAHQFRRVRRGYAKTLSLTALFGIVATLLFVIWGEPLFGIFMPEPTAMREGGAYLRIMGYSQLFMVLEIVAAGALNGMGKTLPPALSGITFNLMRIPLALWWGAAAITGIWWAITVSSVCKGTVLTIVLLRHFRKLPSDDQSRGEKTPPLPRVRGPLQSRIRQEPIEGSPEGEIAVTAEDEL